MSELERKVKEHHRLVELSRIARGEAGPDGELPTISESLDATDEISIIQGWYKC